MKDAQRRLAEAYGVVRAAAIDAADAAKSANQSVQRAHEAHAAAAHARRRADAAAREAAEARFLARRASISLGKLLDTLDP